MEFQILVIALSTLLVLVATAFVLATRRYQLKRFIRNNDNLLKVTWRKVLIFEASLLVGPVVVLSFAGVAWKAAADGAFSFEPFNMISYAFAFIALAFLVRAISVPFRGGASLMERYGIHRPSESSFTGPVRKQSVPVLQYTEGLEQEKEQ